MYSDDKITLGVNRYYNYVYLFVRYSFVRICYYDQTNHENDLFVWIASRFG